MSMRVYEPDAWIIVGFSLDGERQFRVFGIFYAQGKFGLSDWRISSPIKGFDVKEREINFHNYTGSTYKCRRNQFELTEYGEEVLVHLRDTQFSDLKTYTFEQYKEELYARDIEKVDL